MRWYHAQKGRTGVSVLAVVETVVAMAATVGIAVYFDTTVHILISACVAPFLLLRSERSERHGARIFQGFLRSGQSTFKEAAPDTLTAIPAANLFYFRMLAAGILTRIYATIRHPAAGIRRIPENWKEHVSTLDATKKPEFAPGAAAVPVLRETSLAGDGLGFAYIAFILIQGFWAALFWDTFVAVHAWLYNALWSDRAIAFRVVLGILLLYLLIALLMALAWPLCHGLAYFYRLSVKSTSLVWFPLVHLTVQAFDGKVPFTARIHEISSSKRWSIRHGLSVVILGLFIVRLVVLNVVQDLAHSVPAGGILWLLIMPDYLFYPWHVAAAVNAALTLAFTYLFLDKFESHLNHGLWSEAGAQKAYQAFVIVSGLISFYTIGVGLWSLGRTVWDTPLEWFSCQFWP